MRRLFHTAGFPVLALCGALLAVDATAATSSVSGRVTDGEGNPVAGADVAIEALDAKREQQVRTDEKGSFIQVGLRLGRYRVTATKEGFQGATLEFQASVGERTELPDLVIRPLAEVAGEAVHERTAEVQAEFAAAVELSKAKKWPEATAAFEKLLTEAPNLPEAHYELGYIHANLEAWDAARAAYEKALELRPDYPEATMALARAYRSLGQEEKASAIVAEAAAGGEADAELQYNLGINLINEGQIPEAIEALRKAVAGNPELADARFQLGSLLIGQGQIPEAIEQLEGYLALSPDNEANVALAEQLLAAIKPKP